MSNALSSIINAANAIATFKLSQQQAQEAERKRRMEALQAQQENEYKQRQQDILNNYYQGQLDEQAAKRVADAQEHELNRIFEAKKIADEAAAKKADAETLTTTNRQTVSAFTPQLVQTGDRFQGVARQVPVLPPPTPLSLQNPAIKGLQMPMADLPAPTQRTESYTPTYNEVVPREQATLGQLMASAQVPPGGKLALNNGKVEYTFDPAQAALAAQRGASAELAGAKTDLTQGQVDLLPFQRALLSARTAVAKITADKMKQLLPLQELQLEGMIMDLEALRKLHDAGAKEKDANVQMIKFKMEKYLPEVLRIMDARADTAQDAVELRRYLGMMANELGWANLDEKTREFDLKPAKDDGISAAMEALGSEMLRYQTTWGEPPSGPVLDKMIEGALMKGHLGQDRKKDLLDAIAGKGTGTAQAGGQSPIVPH